MISNFHDEATCVKLHSSSHKATLFRKSFSRIKRLFQTLTLKRKLVQGNYYRRTHLVTCNTCKTRLVTHSTLLTTRSTRSTRFSPVVLVCPLVVSVCPLVVPVVLPVGLFITDQLSIFLLNNLFDNPVLFKNVAQFLLIDIMTLIGTYVIKTKKTVNKIRCY